MVNKDVLEVSRKDLFKYSYYNDCNKEVAVLNLEKIKDILQVDEVSIIED